jgi:hypothetical protein
MITLRAEGVMAEDLPTIPLDIPFQLQIRADAPRLWNERTPDGVIGYRSERILISTATEGTYQLPGISIDWWNTGIEGWEQARLPTWTLSVAPFASADRRPAAIWDRPATEQDNPDRGAPAGEQAPALGSRVRNGWQALWVRTPVWLKAICAAVLLGALVLLSRMLIRRRKERQFSVQAPTGPRQRDPVPDPREAGVSGQDDIRPVTSKPTARTTPRTTAVDAVEQAYRHGNATAAQQALLHWAALVWPASPPANLAQLARRLEPPLQDDILLLEKAFFSPRPIDWTQTRAWTRLEAATARVGESGQV